MNENLLLILLKL